MNFGFLNRKDSSSSYDSDSSIEDSRNEKKSIKDSLTNGTSKFFSSVIAKKNGLISNLTEKLELSPKKSSKSFPRSTSGKTTPSSGGTSPNHIVHSKATSPGKEATASLGKDAMASPGKETTKLASPKMINGQNGGQPAMNRRVSEPAPMFSSAPRESKLARQMTTGGERAPLERAESKPKPPRPPRPKLEKKASLSGEEVFLRETFVDEQGRRKGRRRNSLLVDSEDEEEFMKKINAIPTAPVALVDEFKTADSTTLEDVRSASQVDLMNFAEDLRKEVSDREECLARLRSMDSGDVEFGGDVQRSASQESAISWVSSEGHVDDEAGAECKEFMKQFVGKIFRSDEISRIEKATFGQHCQDGAGRLWFSRHISKQRANNREVAETVLFQLVQYFAIALFECSEAEDFIPAKNLMMMCFTFYHQGTGTMGNKEKQYLYTYLMEQYIWSSLRFWNAAFYDAVQKERNKKKVCTSGDEIDERNEDTKYQQNIFFGQLGTFTCNMRSLGLSKELCLEFLRKQATIAGLRKDQFKMLRDNIERPSD